MLELTGLYETGEAEFVPVEVQMNQFLEDVKKLVTYRLQEKKICLEIHCNPEELRKTFDPDLMMSAVTNFIDNAVKASDAKFKNRTGGNQKSFICSGLWEGNSRGGSEKSNRSFLYGR